MFVKMLNFQQNIVAFDLNRLTSYTSFPVIHKVGNVDIFVLPIFEKYER